MSNSVTLGSVPMVFLEEPCGSELESGAGASPASVDGIHSFAEKEVDDAELTVALSHASFSSFRRILDAEKRSNEGALVLQTTSKRSVKDALLSNDGAVAADSPVVSTAGLELVKESVTAGTTADDQLSGTTSLATSENKEGFSKKSCYEIRKERRNAAKPSSLYYPLMKGRRQTQQLSSKAKDFFSKPKRSASSSLSEQLSRSSPQHDGEVLPDYARHPESRKPYIRILFFTSETIEDFRTHHKTVVKAWRDRTEALLGMSRTPFEWFIVFVSYAPVSPAQEKASRKLFEKIRSDLTSTASDQSRAAWSKAKFCHLYIASGGGASAKGPINSQLAIRTSSEAFREKIHESIKNAIELRYERIGRRIRQYAQILTRNTHVSSSAGGSVSPSSDHTFKQHCYQDHPDGSVKSGKHADEELLSAGAAVGQCASSFLSMARNSEGEIRPVLSSEDEASRQSEPQRVFDVGTLCPLAFSTVFSAIEEMAFMHIKCGLFEEALALYRTHDLCNLRSSPTERPVTCQEYQALFQSFGFTEEKDELPTLLGLARKPYRMRLASGTISYFDFRCYLFAREQLLLSCLGRGEEAVSRGLRFIRTVTAELKRHESGYESNGAFPRYVVWTILASINAAQYYMARFCKQYWEPPIAWSDDEIEERTTSASELAHEAKSLAKNVPESSTKKTTSVAANYQIQRLCCTLYMFALNYFRVAMECRAADNWSLAFLENSALARLLTAEDVHPLPLHSHVSPMLVTVADLITALEMPSLAYEAERGLCHFLAEKMQNWGSQRLESILKCTSVENALATQQREADVNPGPRSDDEDVDRFTSSGSNVASSVSFTQHNALVTFMHRLENEPWTELYLKTLSVLVSVYKDYGMWKHEAYSSYFLANEFRTGRLLQRPFQTNSGAIKQIRKDSQKYVVGSLAASSIPGTGVDAYVNEAEAYFQRFYTLVTDPRNAKLGSTGRLSMLPNIYVQLRLEPNERHEEKHQFYHWDSATAPMPTLKTLDWNRLTQKTSPYNQGIDAVLRREWWDWRPCAAPITLSLGATMLAGVHSVPIPEVANALHSYIYSSVVYGSMHAAYGGIPHRRASCIRHSSSTSQTEKLVLESLITPPQAEALERSVSPYFGLSPRTGFSAPLSGFPAPLPITNGARRGNLLDFKRAASFGNRLRTQYWRTRLKQLNPRTVGSTVKRQFSHQSVHKMLEDAGSHSWIEQRKPKSASEQRNSTVYSERKDPAHKLQRSGGSASGASVADRRPLKRPVGDTEAIICSSPVHFGGDEEQETLGVSKVSHPLNVDGGGVCTEEKKQASFDIFDCSPWDDSRGAFLNLTTRKSSVDLSPLAPSFFPLKSNASVAPKLISPWVPPLVSVTRFGEDLVLPLFFFSALPKGLPITAVTIKCRVITDGQGLLWFQHQRGTFPSALDPNVSPSSIPVAHAKSLQNSKSSCVARSDSVEDSTAVVYIQTLSQTSAVDTLASPSEAWRIVPGKSIVYLRCCATIMADLLLEQIGVHLEGGRCVLTQSFDALPPLDLVANSLTSDVELRNRVPIQPIVRLTSPSDLQCFTVEIHASPLKIFRPTSHCEPSGLLRRSWLNFLRLRIVDNESRLCTKTRKIDVQIHVCGEPITAVNDTAFPCYADRCKDQFLPIWKVAECMEVDGQPMVQPLDSVMDEEDQTRKNANDVDTGEKDIRCWLKLPSFDESCTLLLPVMVVPNAFEEGADSCNARWEKCSCGNNAPSEAFCSFLDDACKSEGPLEAPLLATAEDEAWKSSLDPCTSLPRGRAQSLARECVDEVVVSTFPVPAMNSHHMNANVRVPLSGGGNFKIASRCASELYFVEEKRAEGFTLEIHVRFRLHDRENREKHFIVKDNSCLPAKLILPSWGRPQPTVGGDIRLCASDNQTYETRQSEWFWNTICSRLICFDPPVTPTVCQRHLTETPHAHSWLQVGLTLATGGAPGVLSPSIEEQSEHCDFLWIDSVTLSPRLSTAVGCSVGSDVMGFHQVPIQQRWNSGQPYFFLAKSPLVKHLVEGNASATDFIMFNITARGSLPRNGAVGDMDLAVRRHMLVNAEALNKALERYQLPLRVGPWRNTADDLEDEDESKASLKELLTYPIRYVFTVPRFMTAHPKGHLYINLECVTPALGSPSTGCMNLKLTLLNVSETLAVGVRYALNEPLEGTVSSKNGAIVWASMGHTILTESESSDCPLSCATPVPNPTGTSDQLLPESTSRQDSFSSVGTLQQGKSRTVLIQLIALASGHLRIPQLLIEEMALYSEISVHKEAPSPSRLLYTVSLTQMIDVTRVPTVLVKARI